MSQVSARLAYKYQVFITNGQHAIISDEPLRDGGSELGPGPYELLCASLAACKAMTVRMYADRKQWALSGIDMTVSHEKVKAADCDECESTRGYVDIFDCEMTFHGELDDAQRDRLLAISHKCPVHRSLLSETIIHTTMPEPAV